MATQQAPQADHSLGWRTLTNRHTGERLQLRRIVRDGATCLELKGTLPPRQDGPPLHVHYYEQEEGTVVAGTLAAEVDGRQLRVEAGGWVLLPIGSAHRWWNAGDETPVFEGVARPAVDLDVYLAAAFEVLNSGPANRPPLFYMAHLAWRHRKTQAVLLAPRWARAIVVPLIVLVGTILGRYRGTEWPGCPARCAPAPVADMHEGLRERRPTAEFA
jgi:quercetin dioxygenase-like cupin family protein